LEEFMTDTAEFVRQRAVMVEVQLRRRGIRDERLLAAMGRVPRERFVAREFQAEAYADGPLPIGHGQTISQPVMVAIMIEALQIQPSDRVLEVGTGTGYEAAILSELAFQVWTVERNGELAERANEILHELGCANVFVIHGDGSVGLPEQAPYDKILVAAGTPKAPPSVVAQLAGGGIMVVPVGDHVNQQLQVIRKTSGGIVSSAQTLCSFVPLVGAEGWEP
jgi:protein-L-isoaspartate(D-aspartate) O-methyltransferase